jgi:CBS domain-containing protein
MKTVKEILDAKGHEVLSITAEDSVYDAVKLMADKDVGALVVLDQGKLKGLFSERDYARKITLKGRASPDTKVEEVMTKRVICTNLNHTAEECMALVTEKRVRHLPVVEDNQIIGMVSIGDLVKAIISDQKFIIEQLEHYITS